MRLILGADLHGQGTTPADEDLAVKLFKDALDLAVKHGASAVAWLGDLLHHKYGLNARILLRWGKLVLKYREQHGIITILLPGNHDIPWKNECEHTVLALVPGAEVYLTPRSYEVEGTLLSWLPWRPPGEFAELSQELAIQAQGHTGLKFLFSHVSLQEGIASVTNTQVEQPIRLRDLYPDAWTRIFLGDYHAHQTVGLNVEYLGAPRPTSFGDHNCRGLWCFDVWGGKWSLTSLELPSRYPAYRRTRLGPFEEPIIPEWNDFDHWHVEAPLYMHPELERKYPRIKCAPAPGEKPVFRGRLSIDQQKDPWEVYVQWRQHRELDAGVYDPIAREMLGV